MQHTLNQLLELIQQGISAIFRFVGTVWTWAASQIQSLTTVPWSLWPVWKQIVLALIIVGVAIALFKVVVEVWTAGEKILSAFATLVGVFVRTLPNVAIAGMIALGGLWVLNNVDLGLMKLPMTWQSSTATFSNECGSQTLTQAELQAGAIPDQIIPCPRPRVPPVQPAQRTLPPAQQDNSAASVTAQGVFALAARQSKDRNFCRAAENFRVAAANFARAGDTTAAQNAIFQASMVAADYDDQRKPSRQQSASNPSARGPISDSCLFVGKTKVVSGSIGECTKHDGSIGHWNFTMVRSTLAKGCPQAIEFSMLDPDTAKREQWFTPFNVQTCAAPPVAIQTVK